MAYTGYVSTEDYTSLGYDTVTEDLQKKLKQASRNVDLLTFNRINGAGLDNLTEYQQGIVKECVCELADFYDENEDMIQSVLQSYSINGVSMSFGNSWNVIVSQGIAIKRDTYRKLITTGLCRRVI